MPIYEIESDGSSRRKDGNTLDEFLIAHPIGSYYITEESENPVDKYGGGWLKIQGKFLLGATDGTAQTELTNLGYSRSSNGYHYWTDASGVRHSITPNSDHYSDVAGEAMHTLTIPEMPSHSHAAPFTFNHSGNWYVGMIAQGDSSTSLSTRDNVVGYRGDSQPHNNMPPYHIVNIWKRIS